MKSWYSVKMMAGGAEVMIYDEIGLWGITAKDFIESVKTLNANALTVRVNSPGGSVFDGIAIYNFLKNLSASGTSVSVIVDGWAASIASVIMLAGSDVAVGEGSFVMIHNPGWMCFGTSEDLRKHADDLDKFRESILDIYVKETGQDREQLSKWMDDETWFTADEAVNYGFADRKEERAHAVACASPRNMTFKHVPQSAMSTENNSKSKNMKAIAKLLGLPEDATESQISDSIAKLQTESKELATAKEHSSKMEARAFAADAELVEAKKIIDSIKAKDTELAQMKASLEAKTEDAKKMAEAMSSIGIKVEASAKDNFTAMKKHVEALAASRAAEIVASQGGSSALSTGAADNAGSATLTGRDALKAKMFKNLQGSN